MGETRFIGTGETRGYPYLVCKKYISRELSLHFTARYMDITIYNNNLFKTENIIVFRISDNDKRTNILNDMISQLHKMHDNIT